MDRSEVRDERSRPRSPERDSISVKSHGSDRRSERRKDTSVRKTYTVKVFYS